MDHEIGQQSIFPLIQSVLKVSPFWAILYIVKNRVPRFKIGPTFATEEENNAQFTFDQDCSYKLFQGYQDLTRFLGM